MTSKVNKKNLSEEDDTIENLKVIGFYKRQAWAQKFFEKIDEDNLETEGKNKVLAPSILQSQNGLFFPAFMSIDVKKKGEVSGAYLFSENDENIQLIPLEKVMTQLENDKLLPFRYRTLSEIPGDQFQKNWPDFS